MPGILFKRMDISIPNLFVPQADQGILPSPVWNAFLLYPGAEFSTDTPDLEQTWKEIGYYLFAPKKPASLGPAYVDSLLAYLADTVSTVVRFNSGKALVFLSDPDMEANDAGGFSFSPENVQLIEVKKDSNEWIIHKDAVFPIGNQFANLQIPKGAEVALEVTADYSGIRLLKKTNLSPAYKFSILDKELTAHAVQTPKTVEDNKELCIPLMGEGCGCFRFRLGIDAADRLPNLDVGLKYFFPQTERNENGLFQKQVKELSLPLWAPGQKNERIHFDVSIDPIDLLNMPNDASDMPRTYFAFTGETEDVSKQTDGISETVFHSYFKTLMGYAVDLRPVVNMRSTGVSSFMERFPSADNARLVFSQRENGSSSSPYYLVPAGDFEIQILSDGSHSGVMNGQVDWLLGLKGTETLRFPYPEGGRVRLRFHPHAKAYAPVFPVPVSSHLNRLKLEDPLTDRFHTSWIQILPLSANGSPLPTQYISQPEGASLYAPDKDDAGTPVFDYIDPTLDLLENWEVALPMIPHDRLIAEPEDAPGVSPELVNQPALIPAGISTSEIGFEQQVLTIARKMIINKKIGDTDSPDEADLIEATTPQGNLVKLQPKGNRWTNLLIGEDQFSHEVRFNHPTSALQKGFQTNQQFLVITDPTNLGTLISGLSEVEKASLPKELTAFYNLLEIKGWPFEINVGQDQRLGDYRNVLIFKFCQESLRERVKNPSAWTQPQDFNAVGKDTEKQNFELQLVSSWLQDYIEDAATNQKDNPYFRDFNHMVDEPQWNGVLALKVDVDASNVPPELLGLMGGINMEKFHAHHIGIEINQVKNSENGLKYKEKSSLFGLIYYRDPLYQQVVEKSTKPSSTRESGFPKATYDFKVLNLQVLFRNSSIQAFACKVMVSLRELFREKVMTAAEKDWYDYILLNGVYEKKNGKDTYTFANERFAKFWVDTNLIHYLEMEKAVFNTLPKQANDPKVYSRISFWGNLNFKKLHTVDNKSFDLLSFGSEPDEVDKVHKEGLMFSNLHLDYAFELGSSAPPTFSMPYEGLQLNLAKSVNREQALYHQLPLTFQGFKFGSASILPKDMGYLDVKMPGLGLKTIQGEWYGLEFKLDMGNAGGLMNNADLKAGVLLAWAPGKTKDTTKHQVYLGIQLPGASSDAKMLSLQGLFKLSIADITLLYNQNQGAADTKNEGFVLKFDDISLKFFGVAKIPPGGATSFYLFGNPNVSKSKKTLGWYAAYNKN